MFSVLLILLGVVVAVAAAAIVGGITDRVVIGVMTGAFVWILYMHYFGDDIDWGPFVRYPMWLVWWSLIALIVVAILAIFIEDPGTMFFIAVLVLLALFVPSVVSADQFGSGHKVYHVENNVCVDQHGHKAPEEYIPRVELQSGQPVTVEVKGKTYQSCWTTDERYVALTKNPCTGGQIVDTDQVGRLLLLPDGRAKCVNAPSPPSSSSTTTTTTTVPASKCAHRENVIYDGNAHSRVIDDGLPADPKEAFKKAKRFAGHDPRILKLYYNEAFKNTNLKPITKPASELTKNGCYTAEAHDLYQQLLGQFANAKVETDNAPANGTNTGVTPGGEPFQVTEVITGNRIGIKVTLPNGNVFWIMKRCGNVVTQAPIPAIPQKPPASTPPGPTPTPRTPKCGNDNPDTDSDGVCDKRPYNQRTAVYFPPKVANTEGAVTGRATETHKAQTPSETPNPKTGSREPPSIQPGGTNPTTPAPHPGTTVPPIIDPCNGDADNCG